MSLFNIHSDGTVDVEVGGKITRRPYVHFTTQTSPQGDVVITDVEVQLGPYEVMVTRLGLVPQVLSINNAYSNSLGAPVRPDNHGRPRSCPVCGHCHEGFTSRA